MAGAHRAAVAELTLGAVITPRIPGQPTHRLRGAAALRLRVAAARRENARPDGQPGLACDAFTPFVTRVRRPRPSTPVASVMTLALRNGCIGSPVCPCDLFR